MSRASRRVGRGGHWVAVLLALVLTAAIGVLSAGPAQAHAVLDSSTPQDGSRLTATPGQVVFVFDEAVIPVEDGIAVLADDGARVDRGVRLDQDGKAVVVELESGLPDGAYTAGYRVVSGDGHVVSGAIRFGINADAGVVAATAAAPAASSSLEMAHDGAQGAVYLGLALLAGVTAAVGLVWPQTEQLGRTRLLWWIGWWTLLAGSGLRLMTAGPVAEDTGWAGVLRFSGLDVVLTEPGGAATVARVVLLAVLAVLVRPPVVGTVRRAVVVATTALLLVSVAVDGHAAAGDDVAVAVLATTVHLAAMSCWLGGLAVFWLVVLAPASDVPPRHRRWSLVAYLSVALLVLSGEYQGWRQVQPLDSLTTTDYGRTLLLKLALVAAALALAVACRRLILRGTGPDRRRLRVGVAAESLVVAAVLAVTTVLVATPPARTTYGPPAVLTAPLADGRAEVRIDPTRTGVQTVVVRTLGPNGEAVSARAVSATLGTGQVSGITVPLRPQPDGTWTGNAVVPVAGTWTLTVTVQLDQGSFVTAASYTTW